MEAAQQGSARSEEALARLCSNYWYPLYAFARRRGYSPHDAEDVTQGFFARLAEKEFLCGLKREGGRFRSYLLTAFKRFLANEWHRAHAQKRGNGAPSISIDDEAEWRYRVELVDDSTPETLFERHWALTVLKRVFERLKDEYAKRGKAELFHALCGCLPGLEADTTTGNDRAEPQMHGTALRMAGHRLRRRYGELLRTEIETTVSDASQVDDEIRHLMTALR